MFTGLANSLNPVGWKTLIAAFERRLEHVTTHPVLGCRVSMRRLTEVQCRLLSRHFQGEIAQYPHYIVRETMMARERLLVVTFDVSDQERWCKVFRLPKGFWHWIQHPVFQCRLTARRGSEMMAGLECESNIAEDNVLIIAMGPVDGIELKIESLGKPYEAPKRHATVV